MSGTGEDVNGGGEHRPSEDGGGTVHIGLRLAGILARSMKALRTLDWAKVTPVGQLYDDASRSPIVKEMISHMGSPTIDGDRLREWLSGAASPSFGVRARDPHKKKVGRKTQRLRAGAALRNALTKVDERKELVRVANEALREAEEDVSNAALLERAMSEWSFLAEVAETAKPLFSLGVGWTFLKCLAMRDPLVPKDPNNPSAKHDYDPYDEYDGPYAYGYQDMFERVDREKLGDEIRVIQVVMHHLRDDRFFQATVKQELFTICVRHYAQAMAHYRNLSVNCVHEVSPAIGDDEVLRVLMESMQELPPSAQPDVGKEDDPGLF